MSLFGSLLAFVVSLLVGGFGLYVGALVVVGERDYRHALVTAFVGAVVWGLVTTFLGWIPLLGSVFAFLAYLAVVNVRYSGGWVDAAIIAIVAWGASVAMLLVLGFLGLGGFEALGVPGV